MNDDRHRVAFRHGGTMPHPIEFTIDGDGKHHFAVDCQPLRTVINPHSLSAGWATLDHDTGIVSIMLDGQTVVYDRTGYDLAGNWICDLRIGQKRGIEG